MQKLLDSFHASSSRQVWPVWKNSARADVAFHPTPRGELVKCYWSAIRLERRSRTQKNMQDGALGRNAIAILHAFVFDCIDYATGKLDPSYEAIARAANISVRSVARGLAKLKAAGVITWIRRCYWSRKNGQLEQDTNAYSVLPSMQWRSEAARNVIEAAARAAHEKRYDRREGASSPAGDRQAAPKGLSAALDRMSQARGQASPRPPDDDRPAIGKPIGSDPPTDQKTSATSGDRNAKRAEFDSAESILAAALKKMRRPRDR